MSLDVKNSLKNIIIITFIEKENITIKIEGNLIKRVTFKRAKIFIIFTINKN